jgi:hypothetical protein
MICPARNHFSGQISNNSPAKRLAAPGGPHFWLLAALILCAVVAGSGCGKKTQAATPPLQPVAQAQPLQDPNQPATPPPTLPPAPPPAALPPQADLSQINRAYIGWIIQTHRHAKTFQEFVTASGIQVPDAPPGKKYIVDKNGYIALVNQ